jgi:hypothetical protein
MSREFKTTQIDNHYYLYPIPVIKNQKYLIQCSDYNQSIELIRLIHNKEIIHPDNSLSQFIRLGTHTDNKTPIYKIVDL